MSARKEKFRIPMRSAMGELYQAGCWGGQGEKLQEARGGCGQAGPGARGWEGITPVHWSPGRKTSLHSSAGNSKAL